MVFPWSVNTDFEHRKLDSRGIGAQQSWVVVSGCLLAKFAKISAGNPLILMTLVLWFRRDLININEIEAESRVGNSLH